MRNDDDAPFVPHLAGILDEIGKLSSVGGGGGEGDGGCPLIPLPRLEVKAPLYPLHTRNKFLPAKVGDGEVTRKLAPRRLLLSQLPGLNIQLLDRLLDCGGLVEDEEGFWWQVVYEAAATKERGVELSALNLLPINQPCHLILEPSPCFGVAE